MSRIRPNPLDSDSQIQKCVQKICFVNLLHPTCYKDSICRFVLSYGVQKICFMDLFHPTVLKRFGLWICFGVTKIPNYFIYFISEGVVYDSSMLIPKAWKDDYVFWFINKQRKTKNYLFFYVNIFDCGSSPCNRFYPPPPPTPPPPPPPSPIPYKTFLNLFYYF